LASDRIRAGGVVAFVSNNSFVDQIAFDGMRKCLGQDFDKIYVVDLGGNVRKNPKLSGTTHNVFGIQVGVAITVLVKKTDHSADTKAQIFYASVGEDWKKQQKYDQLDSWKELREASWLELKPDAGNNWLTEGQRSEYGTLMLLGDKDSKFSPNPSTIFRLFSLGLATNRDTWVYSFNESELETNVNRTIKAYTRRMDELLAMVKVIRTLPSGEIIHDGDDRELKWTDKLVEALKAQEPLTLDPNRVTVAAYRPFVKKFVYFDSLLNQRQYQQHRIFPRRSSENLSICVNDIGYRSPLTALAVNSIPDLHIGAGSDGFQTFPFYTYDPDGTNRQENITDWALAEFRSHYGDSSISKWDIFHYTYGILHHPEYRTRYAANLKRELPRIPKAPEFRRFAEIGAALMALHIGYETQPEYPLQRTETGQLNWRVEKMTLSKDKTQLKVNEFLTLSGIPPQAQDYRLGNRSALEWVVDQYRVSTDSRSGIVNDPNRADDPEYIVRLIGQVVTVSAETVRLVNQLAALSIDQA
jgi:predicted helicase